MNNFELFIFVKFTVETLLLALGLAYGLTKERKKSFGLIYSKIWLFPLSAFFQTILYQNVVLPWSNFAFQYVLWNFFVLWYFWKACLAIKPRLASLLIAYLVVAYQYCQLIITFFIYLLPGFQSTVSLFTFKESLFSTFLIGTVGLIGGRFALSIIPNNIDLERRETWLNNTYMGLFFIGELVFTKQIKHFNLLNNQLVLLLLVLFILLNLYFLIAMNMIKERSEKMKQVQIQEQYRLELQHYEQIQILYKSFREIRHETENQLFYINQLFREKNYGLLEEYFSTMTQGVASDLEFTDYGNQLVNAVLWAKEKEAASRGIPIDVNANLPEILAVEGYDLTSLLGNLVDNSLEASRVSPSPAIKVTLKQQQGYLYCSVENRIHQNNYQEKLSLVTSKDNKLEHGYGIMAVKRIAEKYNGMTQFSNSPTHFTATVMLLLDDKLK